MAGGRGAPGEARRARRPGGRGGKTAKSPGGTGRRRLLWPLDPERTPLPVREASHSRGAQVSHPPNRTCTLRAVITGTTTDAAGEPCARQSAARTGWTTLDSASALLGTVQQSPRSAGDRGHAPTQRCGGRRPPAEARWPTHLTCHGPVTRAPQPRQLGPTNSGWQHPAVVARWPPPTHLASGKRYDPQRLTWRARRAVGDHG